MMMPKLPMELWIKNILNFLGDGLHNFIDSEADFHSKVDKAVVKNGQENCNYFVRIGSPLWFIGGNY
jgi:hypothetical protein